MLSQASALLRAVFFINLIVPTICPVRPIGIFAKALTVFHSVPCASMNAFNLPAAKNSRFWTQCTSRDRKNALLTSEKLYDGIRSYILGGTGVTGTHKMSDGHHYIPIYSLHNRKRSSEINGEYDEKG